VTTIFFLGKISLLEVVTKAIRISNGPAGHSSLQGAWGVRTEEKHYQLNSATVI
jgi:hypothetical protein